MATSALEVTTFEPTRFFEEKAPRGFEPSVKVVSRVSGLVDFRETTEDRRRRPQVNPTPNGHPHRSEVAVFPFGVMVE